MLINKEAELVINLLKDIGLFSFVDEDKHSFYKTLKKAVAVPKVMEKSNNNVLSNNVSTISSKPSVINNITSNNISNKLKKVNDALKNMKTLQEVKEFLNNFQGCTLAETATNTVFGVGNAEADLLMIGEAPGADEDIKGEPFVGRSGQLLTKALYSVGIHREKIFTTNSVFWRPPGNRNPNNIEINICKPFLQKMISLIKPKMVLIVGRVAANTLLEEDLPISAVRGKWLLKDWGFPNNLVNNIQVRVIYHPAYLLRNPKQKKVFWFDLLEVFNKVVELKLTV